MATRHRMFADVEASGWKRTRRVTTGDMDITPMIDVVFLLLIFFMVASTMQGTPEIDVPPAVHSLGVEANNAVVVTIFAASARGAERIVLGDGAGDEGSLDDVKRYVADAARAGKTNVVLKAEGDVPHGIVNQLSRAIGEVEGVKLYVGVGDQPSR